MKRMSKPHSFFLFLGMLKIGLTGGIGSGKTTVAKIFEVLGIPVLYADEVAKNLMNTDDDLIKAIKEHFGFGSYLNGKLNRQYLSKAVFRNDEKLALLNQLVHPKTIAFATNWMNNQDAAYAIKEAAILFESNSHIGLDFVIGVTAPEALRIHRIIERDQTAESAVRERMKNQMNETEKMNRCDFVVQNNEEDLIITQVLAIHKTLLEKSISSI